MGWPLDVMTRQVSGLPSDEMCNFSTVVPFAWEDIEPGRCIRHAWGLIGVTDLVWPISIRKFVQLFSKAVDRFLPDGGKQEVK
ncbi:hypothetical protein [Sphingopyxis witflariensis]|uniref:hypothetical protein n=1 Tax=Sphingopyxis witflariensis TaxID=173675 RepID=UPI001F1B2E86|nr:hypothetical protein [Sphingopyxis witflariensis]